MSSLVKSFAVAMVCLSLIAAVPHGALALAQYESKLRLKVALVDRDLNVKPVPKQVLLVQKLNLDGVPDREAPAQELTTAFDGTATLTLAPGSYQISAQKPSSSTGRAISGRPNSGLRLGRTHPSS